MSNEIFNTPIEMALRIIFILNMSKKSFDIQRLVFYNYLVLHSSDINGGPKSLHPELPNRSCEILITRKIIEKGLRILLNKELVSINYRKTGIYYKSNRSTPLFLKNLRTKYSEDLAERVLWAAEEFDKISEKDLNSFMGNNINKWGGEFSN